MLLFLISILSGIISGMGIGGGTILIPALTIIFKLDQHIAQSINLISFIPIASVAVITHFKNNNIDLKLSSKLILSGILGAVAGSILSSVISSDVLKKLFAVFLFFMGIYEITYKKNR